MRLDKLAAYFKKLEGQPVVLDKSYEKYFSLEYYCCESHSMTYN